MARLLTAILAATALAVDGGAAVAQVHHAGPGPNRQGQSATGVGVGGAASSVGVNANTNTLTTGSNTNRTLNTNGQSLSGNNTGTNNGSLEVYSGADPYQGIVLEGSVNLPQLPTFVPAPNNFSQPYRPDAFVNLPAFLPAEVTLAEAAKCRNSRVTWYGSAREQASSIRLYYAGKQQSPTVPMTITNYVGTAMARIADGPFMAALCTAAYTAMSKGAAVGMVDHTVRPRNTTFGIGFGASGGASGLPAAGAHPYAIAGALGFGTGWSDHKVEGEVVLQLTGLHVPSKPGTAMPSEAPADGSDSPRPAPAETTANPRPSFGAKLPPAALR